MADFVSIPVYLPAKRYVSLGLAFGLLVLLPLRVTAAAGEAVHFDIPKQRADIALVRFAQQAGIPVLFPYDTVSQCVANPLSGEYQVGDGLKILLAGTGLEAVTDAGSQIRVRTLQGSGGMVQMNRGKGFFAMLAAALTALANAGNAGAQEAGGDTLGDEDLTQVTITGSRIERAGVTSPTPVTSLAATELTAMAPTTLMAAVGQMPQFLNNQTPESNGVSWTGAAGASILNLRGVGANRTLVLLDGRRVVSSTRRGTIDISLLPESLVSRVDVTTGGASAAYGSDAVSGVVNFMLDTEYTGLKGSVQGGISDLSDNENFKASLAGGMALGERMHVIGAIDYYKAEEIANPTDRDWFQSWGRIPLPGGPSGAEIIAPNVRSRQFTYGGLILSGPFANNQFLPGGQLAPFASGNLASGTAQSGGDGVDLATIGALVPGVERSSAFAHLSYDLSDNAQVFGQVLYGNSFSNFNSPPAGAQYGSWPATIFFDNAFLPDQVRDAMTPTGANSSFRFGRSGDLDYGLGKDIEQDTDMLSVTTGIKGELSGGWRYNAYYQYGRTESDITMYDAIRLDRIYKAIDAVRAPGGEIVCRSTLMFANDGCVPLNLFGVGAPSEAAIDYITADRINQLQVLQQHVLDATIQGEPLATWAGPVSVATGASFRRDWFRQNVFPQDLHDIDMPATADPNVIGYRGLPGAYVNTANIFERGPSTNPRGGYRVWEVFAETIVPLASGMKFARSLDLNTAVRYADYEGSGGIMAWKAGLDWAPLDEIRLRATLSRDVRAGTLSERFDTTRGPGTVDDPFTGIQDQVFSQIAGGNPEVDPEKADTLTFGVVYQPSWLPGFGITADVYDIDIQGAIGQLLVQDIVDQCFAGVQSLCALISRDEAGAINQIRNVFINIAQAKTRGIDFEMFYNRPITLFGGNESLRVRAFATHVLENSTIADAEAPKIDRAGQTGVAGGAPEWQANVSIAYQNGGFTGSIQERWISSGILNATFNAPGLSNTTVNDNTVDGAFYTNLRLGFEGEMNDTGYEIFLNVTNLFDEAPPLAPSFGFTGSSHTNTSLFDTIGRRYNLGVNVRF